MHRNKPMATLAIIILTVFLVTSGCGKSDHSASSEPQNLTIGEGIKIGSLEVTITNVDVSSFVGNEFMHLHASEGAEYIMVRYTIKNIGASPVSSFSMPTIHLMDANGVSYDKDIHASVAFQMEIGTDQKILSDLNPGITTNGACVFEISTQSFDISKWHIFIGSNTDDLVALTSPPARTAPNPQIATEASSPAAAQASGNTDQVPDTSAINNRPDEPPAAMPPVGEPPATAAPPPAQAPSETPHSPTNVNVVNQFYQAVGEANGITASSFVVPEKRAQGPLSSGEISRFFGALQSPLRLADVQSQPDGTVIAHYVYVSSNGKRCVGTSRVKTTQRGHDVLIEGISANERCDR